MAKRRYLSLATTLILLQSLYRTATCELTVEPFEDSKEPGDEVTFTCTHENSTELPYLKWSFANTTLATSGRFQVDNGTLTIANLSHNDAGEYICSHGSDSETAILIVYDMPDYLADGLIIAGIVLVLLIILVIGTVYLAVWQRRRRKAEKGKLIKSRGKKNGANNGQTYQEFNSGS